MRNRTILIADDSATMRSMLVAVVEELGDYQIVEASSGFEALRLLPRENVDLILTDINMPDINGLELISYLRNNPNYKNIPVFIISTEGSARDIEKGKQLGANEYVIKPFSPPALQQLIRQYLS
ncbi:MAG: response regulator [Desulfuromonadaceae bacterium]|nr:response regulator [Desulfuromonadaceae bacterium]MDD2856363.1 response regulator [Desulfuromonadaceae bacterium]